MLVPSWRVLSFVTSAIGAFYFIIFWCVYNTVFALLSKELHLRHINKNITCLQFRFLPESPRWLLTHNRARDAKEILRHIADKNRSSFPSDLEISVPIPNARRGTLWDVFSSRKLASSTVIQSYSWLVNSCVYYGLTLQTNKLGNNLYVSTMLSG